jgi:hypothetical protein
MNFGWRALQKTLVPTRPIGPCTIVTTSQRNRYRIPNWARFRGPAERIATAWCRGGRVTFYIRLAKNRPFALAGQRFDIGHRVHGESAADDRADATAPALRDCLELNGRIRVGGSPL